MPVGENMGEDRVILPRVETMQLSDRGFISPGAIHHLPLWRKNCVLSHTPVFPTENYVAKVAIERVEDGWNAVVPAGTNITVMGAPDPGDDWYALGEVFFVKSIDEVTPTLEE